MTTADEPTRTGHAAAATIVATDAWIDSIDHEVNRMRRQIRLRLQDRIAEMSGVAIDADTGKALADRIARLLDSHGLRVKCNQCGHPAIVRYSKRGDSGVFVFDHTIAGKRTFHGGRKSLPTLQLIEKPPRVIAASKAKQAARHVNGRTGKAS